MSNNPTSTTDPNRFTSVVNTFNDNVLNAALFAGADNVYHVPAAYGTIQGAIDAAVAQSHDQYDPAVILITPDSSEGASVSDVQFTENITLYDGIYLMSSVPNKRVNISGTVTLGSTALGQDSLGNANLTLWYILQDMHFIADGGGAALLDTAVNVVTRLDMTRVDMSNTGEASGDVCVNIDATAVHTVNLDECVWTTAGNNAANYCLSVSGTTHSVTLKNSCSLEVTGATTVNCVVVDDGAIMNAYDSDFVGLMNVGASAATYLSLYRCSVTGNVTDNGGALIVFAANNASTVTTSYSTFIPSGTSSHSSIFDIGGASNIIVGYNCSWNDVTVLTSINNVEAVAATSSWEGGPIVVSAAEPVNSVDGMLWANSTGGAVSAAVPP